MVEQFEVRLDVTGVAGTGEHLEIASTVFLPPVGVPPSGVALVALPGGGYNRRYFDLQLDGRTGYSQAQHHVGSGHVFIAMDHLGVGDSTVPTLPIDFSAVARANVDAARQLVSGLRDGKLINGAAPREIGTTVAIGHSYGGFVLILAQSRDPWFDGVGILGYSAIKILQPWPHTATFEDVTSLRLGNGLEHPMRPHYFHPDVPEDIVAAELTMHPGTVSSSMPWAARHMPGGPANVMDVHPRGRGVVTAAAATIDVPVLCLFGHVDVSPDPWHEPSAYRGSDLVVTAVFPATGHMHNFASSREAIWRTIDDFAAQVDRRRDR